MKAYKCTIKHNLYFLLICLLLLASVRTNAQLSKQKKRDTKAKIHSPTKATLLSAFIPGAGQVYNRKYWKVPVIYAWAAAHIYFADVNNKHYRKYRALYEQKIDTAQVIDEVYENVSEASLRRERENWRRNRDLNYIGLGLLYFLQIIDANVDAHLYEYDISDDLTLHYKPCFHRTAYSSFRNKQTGIWGMRLALKF